MALTHTPDFPLGARGIRRLLVLRGLGGFVGVFGMYYALRFLPLSDATVLTFLAPGLASLACRFLLHQPFSAQQQLATLVSFAGVLLIARPVFLFGPPAPSGEHTSHVPPIPRHANSTTTAVNTPPLQGRAFGVAVGMVGVLGQACAITTLRVIGGRAHTLITVNYFGACSTVVSLLGLALVPGIGLRVPVDAREWGLIMAVSVCGFLAVCFPISWFGNYK